MESSTDISPISKLIEGGKLQAPALLGEKGRDTRNREDQEGPDFSVNKPVAVSWIDIDDVESPEDDLRIQAYDKGAAVFARGEGIWIGDAELYFACTYGGKQGAGQIFRYTPGKFKRTPEENKSPGKLELFAEPNDRES